MNADNPLRRFHIRRLAQTSEDLVDTVAAEEPLGIYLRYWFKDQERTENIAVTMRTPGHDQYLIAGFLRSEGIIRRSEDLLDIYPLGADGSGEMIAELHSGVDVEAWRMRRSTMLSASCGICGKTSRESIETDSQPLSQSSTKLSWRQITAFPAAIQAHQPGFAATGGLHAAAAIAGDGQIVAAFEDIGRHNALDKVVGACLLGKKLPLSGSTLFLTSRSSFELVSKAVMAGAEVLATVGGPSSLAIETARALNLTLVGFVREGHCNVYSGEWRIAL